MHDIFIMQIFTDLYIQHCSSNQMWYSRHCDYWKLAYVCLRVLAMHVISHAMWRNIGTNI